MEKDTKAGRLRLAQLAGQKFKTKGDRIRAAREALGYSQRYVAKALNISGASVCDWETNKTDNLKNENLFALADLFGVRPRWISLGDCAPTDGMAHNPTQARINSLVEILSAEAQTEVLEYVRFKSAQKRA